MKGLLFAAMLLLLVACGKPDIDISQAQPYKALSTEDFSFPGRKRIQLNVISPEAKNHEQLAHTVIKIASEYQRELQASVIWVRLQATPDPESILYAEARYAPDNGGLSGTDKWKWQVTAAQETLSEAEARSAFFQEQLSYHFKGE